ncbi:acyl-CoA thioesterase [Pseudomonas schmalbachii]|uniref:Thioesterase family protein n=1 Tax=Pseudomonas schmalbachii TaxID=2816993 RepID=A0ABS3TML6_9PSED|nr:acyl-CoA thioesterase domain-containing protein [Pseudomonas schmalbachii]MBO3274643.1 thioesterase family protein [Pseudomonas schmalbachii]
MNFSELIQAVRTAPGQVVIPSTWSQGRASFGGLVAALAHEAMRARMAEVRPVRSLAITFVGPVEADVPVAFEVDILREGKAVSQVFCRAVQNGEVVTVVQGSFGLPRESAVAVDSEPAPSFKGPEESQELPFVRGAMPEFLQHFAMCFSVGGLPFTSNKSRQMGGWMGFRHGVGDEQMEAAHLLALVDTWPPAVLPHLSAPAPGSSLTWTIEFVQPMPRLAANDWCRYLATIEHARDGYGHAAAQCWTPDGELLAISRQTVTVFG